MKPIVLALTLFGCNTAATTPHFSGEPSASLSTHPDAVSAPSRSLAVTDKLATIDDVHIDASSHGPLHTTEVPFLHCTSSAYSPFTMWGEPDTSDSADPSMYDVHRMVLAKRGPEIIATVHTGHPHDPTQLSRSNRHVLRQAEVTDTDLYIDWHGVSIYGWKSERDTIFSGGAWGELDRPTLATDASPAPPCGFEVEMSCWDPNTMKPEFTYDPDSGLCTNEQGDEGLNQRSVAFIRDTKDGQCTDLSWAVLNEYVAFDSDLSGWDLRGARLHNAALSHTAREAQDPVFVMLSDARLEGADMTTLDIGMGVVEGSIDAHTKLPNVACAVSDDRVDCEG